MNEQHIEKNIVSRKRKARRRKAHLRRLQNAYERLLKDFGSIYFEYLKLRNKRGFQFWK